LAIAGCSGGFTEKFKKVPQRIVFPLRHFIFMAHRFYLPSWLNAPCRDYKKSGINGKACGETALLFSQKQNINIVKAGEPPGTGSKMHRPRTEHATAELKPIQTGRQILREHAKRREITLLSTAFYP